MAKFSFSWADLSPLIITKRSCWKLCSLTSLDPAACVNKYFHPREDFLERVPTVSLNSQASRSKQTKTTKNKRNSSSWHRGGCSALFFPKVPHQGSGEAHEAPSGQIPMSQDGQSRGQGHCPVVGTCTWRSPHHRLGKPQSLMAQGWPGCSLNCESS